ncbi:MAG TPA: hypothetical protein VKB34_11685 [Povalibacter sp.]|nr:hypothetical protein [Povalibacter sp.]
MISHQFSHLSNTSIKQVSGNRSWQISLSDLSVLVQDLKPQSDDQPIKVYEIRRLLRGKELPDIDLTLGLLDRAVVVYWRETYKHRTYKQGLFKVVDGELTLPCEGFGGVDVSH